MRESITGLGSSASKIKCILQIITAKNNPDLVINKKKEEAGKKAHVRLNRNRYCNVMFADDIRNKLATRGGNLTAAEQTAGIKKGEVLHRKICEEYNNTDKHNQHAHPHLMKACKEDPSIFIAPLTWQQSKVELERLLKQYEYFFNSWKISGQHGAFDDAVEETNDKENKEQKKPLPFANFVGSNQSLRYLHEFVYQFPNIFEKAIGHLPEGAFRESIGDQTNSSSTPHTSGRKKTRLKQVKEDNISMLQKYLNMEKREEALANQSAAC